MDVKVLEIVAEKLYTLLHSLKYNTGRTYTSLEEAMLLLCNELPPYSSIVCEIEEFYANTLQDKMSDITLSMDETYKIDITPNLGL